MLSGDDCSRMTLDELVSEETRMKAQRTLTALVIGVTIGIAAYAATHGSSILPVFLLILVFRVGSSASQNSRNLTSVQAEIRRKDPVR